MWRAGSSLADIGQFRYSRARRVAGSSPALRPRGDDVCATWEPAQRTSSGSVVPILGKRGDRRRGVSALFSDYLLTVQGDTDSSANRERRRELLRGLPWTLFDRKDNRLSSPEQRRSIWHSDEKNCARCGRALTLSDSTVDHVRAWSKGGNTHLRNAVPMHQRCRSAKGARAA